MIVKTKDDEYIVRIAWNTKNPYGLEIDGWNEICAWAIEKYGLPGHRFSTKCTENYMDFYFQDERDAIHFTLRWS